MSNLPDFLVIGAARAGTTALYSYLSQHPQVFMPKTKEPNFFAFEGETLACEGPGADFINNSVTRIADYHALFAAAPPGTIRGEASPLYLYAPEAPARIRKRLPQARMIAILRNPVEQAFSHFLYATKERIEPEPDFTAALVLEEERLAAGWQPLFGYSRFPRYAEQLGRFFALFPREQFLIRSYEEFQADPATVLSDIFTFIGADPGFAPDMSRKPNAGGVPKNTLFQDFLMKPNPVTKAIGYVVPKERRLRIRDRLAQLNLKRDDTMPDKARAILQQRLEGDIRQLETLLGRAFSAWLA